MAETDGELVRSALRGDRWAFEKIVKRYQRLVFNIVYHYLGRSDAVEDVAQEVFLRFFQNLERYDTSRPLKHWIGRITANRCLDELRKRKTNRVQLIEDMNLEEPGSLERLYALSLKGDPLSESDAKDCLSHLRTAMGCLNEKDRLVFVMREMEGLEYSEIAEVFGSSEVALRIRVSRAKKKLEQELRKVLYGK